MRVPHKRGVGNYQGVVALIPEGAVIAEAHIWEGPAAKRHRQPQGLLVGLGAHGHQPQRVPFGMVGPGSLMEVREQVLLEVAEQALLMPCHSCC